MRHFIFLIGDTTGEPYGADAEGRETELFRAWFSGVDNVSEYSVSIPNDTKIPGYDSIPMLAEIIALGQATFEAGTAANLLGATTTVLIENRGPGAGNICRWLGDELWITMDTSF